MYLDLDHLETYLEGEKASEASNRVIQKNALALFFNEKLHQGDGPAIYKRVWHRVSSPSRGQDRHRWKRPKCFFEQSRRALALD